MGRGGNPCEAHWAIRPNHASVRHGQAPYVLTLYRMSFLRCPFLCLYGREERAALRDGPAPSLHYPYDFPASLTDMQLTYAKIIALQSLNRGWNSEVLELIGVKWPPERGWIKRLINTEIEQEKYDRAFSIKDSHLKPKTIERLRNHYRPDHKL
jgi:hypothetical protein